MRKGIDKFGNETFSLETSCAQVGVTHYPSLRSSNKAILVYSGALESRYYMHDHALGLRERTGYNVFTVDNHAHGDSTGRVVLSEMARSAFETKSKLKEHFDFASLSAWGVSLGAMAVGWAAAHGTPYASLCLTSCPDSASDVYSNRAYGLLPIQTFFHTASLFPTKMVGLVSGALNKLLRIDGERYQIEGYDGPQFGALKLYGEDFNPQVLFNELKSLPPKREIVKSIASPTKLYFGGDDWLIGIRGAKDFSSLPIRYQQMIGNLGSLTGAPVEYEIFEGLDHGLNKRSWLGSPIASDAEVSERFCSSVADFFLRRMQ